MAKPTRASEVKKMAGLRLKAARLVLDVETQEAMANQLQVGHKAYASWENGARMPDITAVVRLWERTGIGPDWIYAGSVRGVPFDYGENLLKQAAELGAVVGGPVAEWPMAAARRAIPREAAAVPRRANRRFTLHERNDPPSRSD